MAIEKAGLKPKPIEMSVKMKLKVGNTYKEVKATDKKGWNVHKWSAHVKIMDRSQMLRCSAFISKVKWELHESFKNPIRENAAVDGKNFEIGSISWGSFDIAITIYFTKETGLAPLSIWHELVYEDGGKW
jgi:transcription initiation factor IIF auxiliary subunit